MSKKKSKTQRMEWLEQRVIGMGFLLLQLQAKYGSSFSIGTDEQVRQAIKDYRSVEHARAQREASAALAAQHARLAKEDGAA